MYLKKLTIAVGLCLATAMSAQDGWTIHAEGECKEAEQDNPSNDK